ncbi:MAG TPA: hypothetical protein VK946_00625 [Methylotenera sp.]|nr:hypothetical protein [Methylotenera sp.]
MFSKYFNNWEVKPEFTKEFVSLFNGWLGVENLHKLDQVTEDDWRKFGKLIVLISQKYEILIAHCESQQCLPVNNVESIIQTYSEAMKKDSTQFTKFVIPELDCIFTEEWDSTYIIWHKNNDAVQALQPLINASGLHNFHD